MAQGEVVYLRYSKLAWVGTGKFGVGEVVRLLYDRKIEAQVDETW